MRSRSWLIRNGSDRERMLDMDRRLRPVRLRTFAVLAAALLASGPSVGWWTIGPLLVAAAVFRVADTRIEGTARPEYWMFAAWAGAEAIIAVSLALTGSSAVSMLAMLSIPIVTLSARFSSRGILIGVAIALGLMVAVALGTNADAIAQNPPLLIAPLAVVVSVAMLSVALMHSDVEHRSKAVLDQLTGLLNRSALEARANELEQQSAITGESVALIVADLDGFKRVNDSYGHASGDAVLKEVAYLVRKRLRAFDLAYRLGGDELLILVPGADLDVGEAVAESLHATISSEALGGGVRVSMSCGVSASRRGEAFDFDTVFRSADAALYEAKRCGGDRVCSDAPPAMVAS
ncbi:MAG TPA: GGDEF domain-containing protein [Solirubrobacterales bacterium]|nr:GGDEF domain-containing protein [Solirubrobacterales bacterium]